MKKHIVLMMFGVLALCTLPAVTSLFTAQTGNEQCVGKPYGYPGCPLKVVSQPSETCGNGRLEDGEECDLGNDNGTGECSSLCTYLYCGDGKLSVGLGEECEPESEEVYVLDPESGNLTTEVRYLSRSCGTVCTAPTCDDNGNCAGGCTRQNLPACPAQFASSKSPAGSLQQGTSSVASPAAAAASVCGNGTLDAGEQCDDGNKTDADACSNNCRIATCGDALRQPWEQCDDGNKVEGDTCSNECVLPACGDGTVQKGEECDDGNTINDDACANVCRNATCGDGILHRNEACDDGNAVNDDACTNACAVPRCGDAIRQINEECDDGNLVEKDNCSNACTLPLCGDGVIQRGEQCDDGNSLDNDMCNNVCRVPLCGDGVRAGTEQCDDGNSNDADMCTGECVRAACGDGIVQTGEQCDDGNTINSDSCPRNCQIPVCGNNVIEGSEECDIGRKNSDTAPDICRKSCVLPYCGDGIKDGGEECDGGALCSNECSLLKAAATTESPSAAGFIPYAVLLGIFGFIAIAAFALRKEVHTVVSKVAGEDVARSIDDIPLDEIEMPWHKWS